MINIRNRKYSAYGDTTSWIIGLGCGLGSGEVKPGEGLGYFHLCFFVFVSVSRLRVSSVRCLKSNPVFGILQSLCVAHQGFSFRHYFISTSLPQLIESVIEDVEK